jgi:hypothetical protein
LDVVFGTIGLSLSTTKTVGTTAIVQVWKWCYIVDLQRFCGHRCIFVLMCVCYISRVMLYVFDSMILFLLLRKWLVKRRILGGSKCGTHVQLGLLLDDVISNENDENEADNDQNRDDLALEDGNDGAVDDGMAGEVPKQSHAAQQGRASGREARRLGTSDEEAEHGSVQRIRGAEIPVHVTDEPRKRFDGDIIQSSYECSRSHAGGKQRARFADGHS